MDDGEKRPLNISPLSVHEFGSMDYKGGLEYENERGMQKYETYFPPYDTANYIMHLIKT